MPEQKNKLIQDTATIISLKEARKILGLRYRDMPDDEITSMINDLEFMAKITLKHLNKSLTVPPSAVGGFQTQKINDNSKEKC